MKKDGIQTRKRKPRNIDPNGGSSGPRNRAGPTNQHTARQLRQQQQQRGGGMEALGGGRSNIILNCNINVPQAPGPSHSAEVNIKSATFLLGNIICPLNHIFSVKK